jgi:3-dehydroquinate synthase
MNQQLIFTDELESALKALVHGLQPSVVVFLADENTAIHAQPLVKALDGSLFTVPAGEQNKGIRNAENIWQAWLDIGLDRHALLINVGGGMVTDLGGFLAATYKRGIRYINVPTSLLAQVDAAFGGKTGINLHHIKNAIGAFHQAEAVLFSRFLLQTLPVRELESGKAEMLKHGLIADKGLWLDMLSLKPGEIPENVLIQKAVGIKAEITARDPFETGERKLLNFGHTIGHALESLAMESTTPLLHGEAIVLGMLAEIEVSVQLGVLAAETALAIQLDLKRLFPHLKAEFQFENWLPFVLNDKKNQGNRVLFTLLHEVGAASYNKAVETYQMQEAWRKLQQEWA